MNKLNKILRVDSESRSFLAVQNDGSSLALTYTKPPKKAIPEEPK